MSIPSHRRPARNEWRERSWHLLAVVGERPSAIASVVQTWVANFGPPVRISLLATPHVRKPNGGVRSVTDRLCQYLGGIGVDHDVLPIADALDSPDSKGRLHEVIARARAGCAAADVAFCADPGPGYLVAAAARQLGSGALFLHANTDSLVCIWRGETDYVATVDLEDLGLEVLLALFGLTLEQGAEIAPSLTKAMNDAHLKVPEGVRSGVALTGMVGSVMFDLAYERRGWLHALAWAGDKEGVRRLQRPMPELNGLKPIMAVVADSIQVKRATTAHVLAIGLKDASGKSATNPLARWLSRQPRPPGRRVARAKPTSPSIRSGRGGTGPPLVVCVGSNPLSTLVSLYTHQPSHAWLAYDASTPSVAEALNRVRAELPQVPCGEVTLIKTDLFGIGLQQKLESALAEQLRADVTPGSNGQSCALALLPNAEVWTLRASQGQAVTLDGSKSLPLVPVDLIVQATVRGGKLEKAPTNAKGWDAKSIERWCQFASRLSRCHWPLWPNQVKKLAKTCGVILNPRSTGAWFEDLVASLFVAAGADEVWVNLAWAWPPDPNKPDRTSKQHRDELDVAVRLGRGLFVVSCTLESEEKRPLDTQAREIEAVAMNLDRLAIPIVVRPVLPSSTAKPVSIKSGAVFLDLAQLSDAKSLKVHMETIPVTRSTQSAAAPAV